MVMAKKARHFKSKSAYQKWLAYGHIHGDFKRTPGYQEPISIAGKLHKVIHKRKR